MKFWKMNGAGNDFIIVNNMEERLSIDALPVIAKTLCERHMSIGADGFMLVCEPGEAYRGKADFRMLFFNSDGSMGEMCGNGARCISRYGYETGISGERQKIETTAGIVEGERLDKRNYKIRLNDLTALKLDEEIEVLGRKITASYVEMGNPGLPHGVVEIEGLAEFPENELFELGRALRHYKGYPKGANINFYEKVGENHLIEKTYERGVEGFTYACGTGTGSVAAVLTLKGEVSGRGVKVDVRGGSLAVDVLRDKNDPGKVTDIFLTGPTNIVAKGEVFDEDLVKG